MTGARGTSFGVVADLYDRVRPGYPDQALDRLLPAHPVRVLDLGAGTGKLTRQLAARGHDVVAVEPDAGMRAVLSRSAGRPVEVLAGTAEQLPVPDASVDVVIAAQAWHWVDPERAVPEAARVLRPGGALALLWNVRDESVGWVAELGRLMEPDVRQDEAYARPGVGAPFGPVERFEVPWQHELAPGDLVELAASRSYVIAAAPSDRERVLAAVAELARTAPELAGRERVALPYVTRCSLARLPV
ncbi:methyltransferase family protein [Motilibacter rhizosphaerae]|uniref:Methyltransferase family protein n=1 Tax=Motilibacter rhizosphaerae TaxID=598652 RepID=A0A4V2F3F6_9ACTN|nr:class I SAM-dependent methyltransferase [Motilibacter rhizosphaerae]RZS82943.1 methyltransferase family protein [Motilibacter rhizosphaerae]